MKHLVLFLLLNASVIGPLRLAAQQKEVFVKQIEFKLDNVSQNEYENEYFLTIKLNKGTNYKFKITNHRDNYAGKAVFELLDADNLVLTNSINDKYFETFTFVCNKTSFYDILVRFKDKKPGNSVIDMYMLQ